MRLLIGNVIVFLFLSIAGCGSAKTPPEVAEGPPPPVLLTGFDAQLVAQDGARIRDTVRVGSAFAIEGGCQVTRTGRHVPLKFLIKIRRIDARQAVTLDSIHVEPSEVDETKIEFSTTLKPLPKPGQHVVEVYQLWGNPKPIWEARIRAQ